ncbi:MAG: sigma-70 family RNA polymerase sigma factor [Clostridia bacterium]|nr:sigma-70 family RNA polymerase sigma factor [Clostridia bacterium]
MISELLATIETEEESHAIAEIYDRYSKRMYAIAYQFLQNPHDAEDAVMDAFTYMCDHPQDFLEYKTPKVIGMICGKVKWTATDIYRKNKRHSNRVAALDDTLENCVYDTDEDDVLDMLMNEFNRDLLQNALRELEIDYALPIKLKYYNQMKASKIAEFMNITESSVNVRIYRGKEKLKKICIEKGYHK